jgi:hypothetical protein
MALATSPRTLPSSERTALRVVPAPDDAAEAARPQRLDLRLTRVRTWSITKAAAALGLVVAIALSLTGVVAWALASRLGVVAGLEETIATGLGMESWTAPAGTLLVGWIAVVAGVTVLAVAFVVLLTVAFNGIARATSGLHLEAHAQPTSS